MITKRYNTGGAPMANYDSYDIIEGTGIKHFYGAITQSGAHILTTSTNLYSNEYFDDAGAGNFSPVEFAHTCAAAFTSPTISKTFTTVFNLPKRIKGNAFVSCSHRVEGGTPAVTADTFLNFSLYKNTTLLGSVSGGGLMHYQQGASTILDYTSLVKIPITSTTKFKKGDELKLKVDLYSKGDSSVWVYFAADPAGRDPESVYDYGSTKLTLAVPFEIDL